MRLDILLLLLSPGIKICTQLPIFQSHLYYMSVHCRRPIQQARPKVIDYFAKQRKPSPAPFTHQSRKDNVVCFYGHLPSNDHLHDEVARVADFIEDMFEKIEADFDLQRYDKYKRAFAVYISHTGLQEPSDLPPQVQSATNEHFMLLSYPFPPSQDIVKELCHSLLHIPCLQTQESICKYIASTCTSPAPPTPPLRLIQETDLAHHPLFWKFISENYGGGKAVGDIADFAFTSQQPHPSSLDVIAKYLNVEAGMLLNQWHTYLSPPVALQI